ncbi:MBL fold metallo-hydrolase [Desulfoscipio gibsoniae]|uniref:Metal-dependent hydrolase, beta-lactamase superfamily II n=1 Tax=Desulfoscipio gibsoniae DSM 7213 TaxID=767817 RepID=R4KF21_9FIRM|nr:MBL fold metallo-hydrolase [Desulfoscipio gibsoniae]AGL00267.1 metal-dependent hydrolase, beta-lactamase superfamily II [Desulfoscipio gibsoniae DSM 7213]
MKVRLTTLCDNTTGGTGLIAEWGLSILAEYRGAKVLLDAGMGDAVVKNADLMGIDLGGVDKIVLSHGHLDHTGGLTPLLQRMGKKIPVYAHPDVWDQKYSSSRQPWGGDTSYHFIGIQQRPETLESLGADFKYDRAPVWLNDYMVTTGEVPMVAPFESIEDNLCVKTEKGYVTDPFLDDQALIIKSERGLVVVLGCAHRGAINTILHAKTITGVDRVHAVVGGTHLLRAGEERINQTAAALRELGVEKLGVSHCTGLPAAAMLAREFGSDFFFNCAGTIVEF